MFVSELSSKNQIKLFSFRNELIKLINLYEEKKFPNKIIFSGNKGIGKATLAYHLTNYILSKDEEYNYEINSNTINKSNRSFNLLTNNSHPNFYNIDIFEEKKNIEISQIREMITYANKSSFNNKEKIILIDNIEYLNINSLNALLKIIEEPNENLIFLLIYDNTKKILKTLLSRCLIFNLSMSHHESIEVTNKILDENIHSYLNPSLINYYNTPGDLINLVNFSKNTNINLKDISLKEFIKNIIDDKHYKKDTFIKNNIYNFIELYLLNLNNKNQNKKNISLLYEYFINKISELKKFNLDEESLFIEFKTKILNE